MPDTIGLEMDLTEPVGSNPSFESQVERFLATYAATTSSRLEWQTWNWGYRVNKSLQGKIWNKRGNFFDVLGGNNLSRTYKAVDYLKGGVVGQIKSIDSTNLQYIQKVVTQAYKKMIEAVKTDSNLLTAQKAELKIIVPTGTNNSVIEAIETAGKKIIAAHTGIKLNTPKIIRGIPGATGTVLKGFGIVGGLFSAGQLLEDIEKGDIASGIGSGTSVAAPILEIGAGVVGSTALAVSAAVVGAFALGYGMGTIINDNFLSQETKDVIGGTLAELVDNGWDNIKDYYSKMFFK